MNVAIEKTFSFKKQIDHVEYPAIEKKGDFLSAAELDACINGCALNDRLSQKRIYNSFYNYALTICNCYSDNYDDSVEILNDGFLKVFKEITRYKPSYADIVSSFKGWIRKIMIHTAIDHFRKCKKHRLTSELDSDNNEIPVVDEGALDKVSYQEILGSIQQLTPGYRVIFNLFVIEGFSHDEIARHLGISVGSSKSNLARGRRQLQKILFQKNQVQVRGKIIRTHSVQRPMHNVEMGTHS